MLRAAGPSFCLLGQSYAIREIEAGADHEAQAAEHVEDAAPDVGCDFHRCATLRLPFLYFASVFVPLADYADTLASKLESTNHTALFCIHQRVKLVPKVCTQLCTHAADAALQVYSFAP